MVELRCDGWCKGVIRGTHYLVALKKADWSETVAVLCPECFDQFKECSENWTWHEVPRERVIEMAAKGGPDPPLDWRPQRGRKKN